MMQQYSHHNRRNRVFPNTHQPVNRPNVIECKKNIYNDHVAVLVRDTTEVEAYRQKYNIIVGGTVPAPNPIESFDEMKDIPTIPIQSYPSPMQSQAWPIILSGLDMIGFTKSGPERTLAYMLPAVLHIGKQVQIRPGEAPIVLILAQSWELILNVRKVVDLFRPEICIRRQLLNTEKKFEIQFRNGVDMVLAVPDIALTMLRLNTMNLKLCSMVIVDFDGPMSARDVEVLREIVKYAPADRQLLWFSQLWCDAARKLAVELMPNGYCSVDARKFQRDGQSMYRQQIHIVTESECRMQ